METNIIRLKRKLTFQEYQMVTNSLERLGIEIDYPENELSQDEVNSISKGIKDIEEGNFCTSEELHSKIKEKYGIEMV
ncbi:hypothetical protein [Ornithobacterium rhinotracheale]|uniref:hypothetical protein n=1 Tax=Ornithobacterium rhinotracheale TaxID=28251 RepID=UPI0040372693